MVEILDNICDMSDICKNKHCYYYNLTREAVEKYMDVTTLMYSFCDEEEKLIKEGRVLRFVCPYLSWKNKENWWKHHHKRGDELGR